MEIRISKVLHVAYQAQCSLSLEDHINTHINPLSKVGCVWQQADEWFSSWSHLLIISPEKWLGRLAPISVFCPGCFVAKEPQRVETNRGDNTHHTTQTRLCCSWRASWAPSRHPCMRALQSLHVCEVHNTFCSFCAVSFVCFCAHRPQIGPIVIQYITRWDCLNTTCFHMYEVVCQMLFCRCSSGIFNRCVGTVFGEHIAVPI